MNIKYPLTKTNVRIKKTLIDELKSQADNHNFLVRTALDNFIRAYQLDRLDANTMKFITGNMKLKDFDSDIVDKTTIVTLRLTSTTIDTIRLGGLKLSRCVHCAIKNLLKDL